MKKTFFLLAIIIMAFSAYSQAPNRMSYQSVIRNSNGDLVTNSSIGVRISILQGSINGNSVYTETHSPSSNTNGLISFQIGNGVAVTGSFIGINWSNGPYFVKTETDPSGGTNYTISGTSQLLSVPYAFYAEKAGNNFWNSNSTGIYYDAGRVAIGTTPNPIVPLTILDNNTNGNGNAVLHLKSNDPWHTALTIFNGPEADFRYYSLIVVGPNNTTAVPGTFGMFNHKSLSWSYNFNPITNNMAIGSTGFNASDPKSKLHVFNGDVNIDQIGSGIIMKSPDGNCWRITINNSGQLIRTSIPCP